MIEITPEMTIAELLEQSNLSMDILQSWVDALGTPPPEIVDTSGVEVLEGGKEFNPTDRSVSTLELIHGKKGSLARALQQKYRLI